MITWQTIATAMGRPTDEVSGPEQAQWSMWIADALMLIEARLGDPQWLDQTALAYVVREAVVAHVRHPDDATQVSMSVDDGQVSRTYQSATGRVAILDEWWALLDPRTVNTGETFDFGPEPVRR